MPPPPHPPCPVREGGGGQQEAGPGDGCGERALFLETARALFLVKQNYSYLGLFGFSGFISWAETFENLD